MLYELPRCGRSYCTAGLTKLQWPKCGTRKSAYMPQLEILVINCANVSSMAFRFIASVPESKIEQKVYLKTTSKTPPQMLCMQLAVAHEKLIRQLANRIRH